MKQTNKQRTKRPKPIGLPPNIEVKYGNLLLGKFAYYFFVTITLAIILAII